MKPFIASYLTIITSTNYIYANTAKNFTTWGIEITIVAFFFIFTVGGVGGYLFPTPGIEHVEAPRFVPDVAWRWADLDNKEVLYVDDAFKGLWYLLYPIGLIGLFLLFRYKRSFCS